MYETYLRETSDNLGYLATWIPTEQLEVGTVGVLKDGRFHRETTLASLGVTAAVAPPGTSMGHLKHYSAGQVSVSFKTAGEQPVKGSELSIEEAGFTVEFGCENSIVFEAVGCKHERVVDVNDIGNQILQRVDAKLWRLDFIVVTEIIRADSATVLISNNSQARFEATIHGAIGTGMASIGDAKLGVTMKRSRSIGTELVAKANLTPLYIAYRVRKNWWNNGRWERARSISGPLEQLSIGDVLSSTPAT